MPRSNSKFFTSLVVGAIVLIALNVFWFGWIPHTAIGKTWASSLFIKSGKLHNLSSSIFRWRGLAQENSDLKSKLAGETSSRAIIARLERENEQLRLAIGLANRNRANILPAGIYDISLAPNGYRALINKGANYNVVIGDVIVGEHNILIGTVQAVFSDSSRVTLISDPSFKVTALVLGGQAKGIARGMLDDGLALDLVVQTDDIKEGDILVSSGDDMLPAGLIIGIVSQVDSNTAKLFKEVSIAPAAEFVVGSVFILKK